MSTVLNQKGLIFELEGMSREDRMHYFKRYADNYVLVGFNWFHGDIVRNYTHWEPIFEEPERMIYLDHTHYPQFEMLRHLDWESITNYFEPLNLRKPT